MFVKFVPTDFTTFANREQFHQSEMSSLSFFQLLPLFSAIPNAVFAQLEGWFFFALLIVAWNFMEITFFTLYKLEKNLWRGQFGEDGGKQVFLITVFCH